jgi:autotransporter-associated beta strand protein/T5SS/PEP-CTERM-associated repeat protein
MKTPTRTLITRASLVATASHNTRWFARLIAGSAVLGTSALATVWDGDVSRDWNDNTNWAGDGGTAGSNAFINIVGSPTTAPFTALISANIPAAPVDIFVGSGGNTGRLDHSAGTAATGGGNWMFVGHSGGTGTYNLADTAGTGGTFTGFAQGTGNMNVGGRLYIGGFDGSGSNGTVNVNTTGTLAVPSQIEIGTNSSTGTLNIDSGSVTAGDWFEVGNGAGCTGFLNMSGGSITKTGGNHFIVAANGATGTMTMTGGTLTVNNEIWVGQAGGSTGTLNISGTAQISNNSWVAIGRGGATLGTVNHSGGTWTKTGSGSAFIVGASGPGVYNHSGGVVDVQAGDTWMGEASTGTYTLSGSGEFRATVFQVARNGGSTGNVNLNGGTLRATRIIGGGGAENVSFNGTQIVAKANEVNFIGGIDAFGATIDSGNLLIDSNGFNLTAPQAFDGDGGVVKSGAGTLTLSGINSYLGDNVVQQGGLVLSAASLSTGGIDLADNTVLGINAPTAGAQLSASTVSFGNGGATTFNVGLGDLNGTNPTNGILAVAGAFDVTGTVTVNVSGSKFAVGDIPLITYDAAQKTGAGTFSLAALPAGVVATLQTNDNFFGPGQGAVFLNVTSVALPKWTGVLVNRFTTGDTSTLSNDVLVANATGIAIGNTVTGSGIDVGTTVTAISGNTVTLSAPPTADALGVELMFVAGPGASPGTWDTSTANWVDQISGTNSVFATSNPVLFDDDAPGSSVVTKAGTLLPSIVTINNSALVYDFTGAGVIDGAASLVKQGTSEAILSTNNSYDGATRIEGGTLTVATLANVGTDSPVGNGSELVIAGGFLNYTGADVVTTRGLTLDGLNGGIRADNDITLQGQISANVTGSNFRKQGAGTLTLTFGGANTLSSNGGVVDVEAGSLVLDGSAGGQVNTIGGELWVASEPDVAANLTVSDTTLNISSWLAVGRGNGDAGVTNITMTDSTVQTGNFSTGFNNGLGANASEAFVNLTNTTWTNTGVVYLAESPDSTATVTLSNSTWITNSNAVEMSRSANTTSSITISGTSEMRTDRVLLGLGNNAVASIVIEDSGHLNKTGGSWMAIGNSGNGQGTITVRDSGTLTNAGGDFNVGDIDTSSGTLNIEDNATVSHAGGFFIAKNGGTSGTVNISGGTLTLAGSLLAGGFDGVTTASATINQTGGAVNLNGDDNRTGGSSPATWNVSAGTVTSNGWMTLGRYANGTGTMNASGTAVVTQNHVDRPFRLGEGGTGVLNVTGSAIVSAPNAGGFSLGGGGGSAGTINLDGGTLVANRIYSGGNDGVSTVSLDGGTLQAATGANLNFVAAEIDTLSLDANNGDSTIDTNGQTVAINKSISDGGGNLIKSGTGSLYLNAVNGYLGSTTVTGGTIGGNGSLDGPLAIQSSASVNPGTSAGTFTVNESVTIDGSYVCELDGAVADSLVISGQLTIGAGAVLDFSTLNAPTAPSYVIATFGSRVGPDFIVQNLPAGYEVVYSATEITLQQVGGSAYDTWASSFGLDPESDGAPGFDKDGDGQVNSVEFALGGSPISGSNNAKVYSLAADSDADGDSTRELILTIAVRSGTPAFTGSPSPTATQDGYTYTIEGSTNLSSFTEAAVPVTPVTTGLPAAPAGYEYRSFSLTGSNGTPAKGFLRVNVTP